MLPVLLLALLQTPAAPQEPAHKPSMKAPVLLKSPDPDYTKCLSHARIKNFVVYITIGVDGTVTTAKITESSGNECYDQAALDAARTYLFKPAMKDGVPCPIDLYIAFNRP